MTEILIPNESHGEMETILETRTLFNYETTKALADTLLYTSKREGVELERRIIYFRGKEIRKCFPDAKDVVSIGYSLIEHGFIHKSTRSKKQQAGNTTNSTYYILQPTENQEFTEDGIYTWMYEGSMFWRNIATVSFLLILGIGVLYPVWPLWCQTLLWNSAVTTGLCTMSALALRFTIWLGIWLVTGKQFWILPQLPRLQPMYQVSTNPKRIQTRFMRVLVATSIIVILCYFATYPPPCTRSKRGCVGLGRKLVKQAYKGTVLERFSQQEKDFVYTVLRILRRLL